MSVHVRCVGLLRPGVLFRRAPDCTASEFGCSTTRQLSSKRCCFLLVILLCCSAMAGASDLYVSSGAWSTDAAAGQSTEIWHASGSEGAKQFITINFSGATGGGTCMAAEFSHVSAVNPVDATATVYDGEPSTSPLGAAVATSSNSDLVVGAITGAVTNIHGGGFGSLHVLGGNAAAWLTTSSAGSYQPQWDSDYFSFAASTVAYKTNGTPALVQSAVVELLPDYSNNCTIPLNPTGAGNLIVVITNIGSISTVVTGVTDGPSTPETRSIDLSWQPSNSGGVIGYNVYRSRLGGGGYLRIGHVAGTSFTDNNAIAGLTYYYAVTAVDNLGRESEFSNETTIIP